MASRRSVGESGERDQGDFNEDLLDEELLGRVVIDLQGIFDGSVTTDTIVEDGDTLFVPKYSNTISVIGEVYEPGTFKFEEGLTLEQYIDIAGGATTYALKKNTYLLKADGSVRFYRSSVKESFEFQCGQYESRRGWRCDCHTH